MAQQLRQRSVSGGSTTVTMEEEDEFILGRGLEAPAMLKATPSQNGTVLKLHVPLLFGILPEFLKRIVVSYQFLSWLQPQWQQRYLILLGMFLYKFKNESSKAPKGTPFSTDRVNANLLLPLHDSQDEMAAAFGQLPPGYDCIFTVSTFAKKHYYAVASRDEALAWVNGLRQNRQEAITRSMGHASHVPYPKSWSYFDSLGQSLQKSKQRIKKRVEDYNMREMELSGAGPQGFYG